MGSASSQHPHWCLPDRCTAQAEGGLHIGGANRVPLGEDPDDALSLPLIQAVTSAAEPDPPVQVGIEWHGRYAGQQTRIVIGLDRAKFFADVLGFLLRTP